jgi:hypothetical protein
MKHNMPNNAPLALLLAAASLLSGQVSNVTFASQVYPIFQNAGCTGCHGSSGGFSIGADAETAYVNIVQGAPGNCGLTYVVPGDPSSSFLYEKISQTPSCGNRMPAGNATYFDTNVGELEIIQVWITEGALQLRDDAQFQPTKYALHHACPNPFNPTTTIRYDLPHASAVSLIVYDLLGQEVAKLVDGTLEPGHHQAQWNAHQVPSGVYIARLATLGYNRSIKMLLLK